MKSVTIHNGKTRKRVSEREKGIEEILELIMPENFQKLIRAINYGSGSSEYTSPDKYKTKTKTRQNPHGGVSGLDCGKSKPKRKS